MNNNCSKSIELEGARRERRAAGASRGGSVARRERRACGRLRRLRAICSSDAGEITAMADEEANRAMVEEAKLEENILQVLQDIANRLRLHVIRSLCASNCW